MKRVVVEEDVVVTDGGDSTASNAIWAVAFIIIVALIAGAVYYSGILKRSPATQKINVEVSAPAAPSR
jgi:hypothetical protein